VRFRRAFGSASRGFRARLLCWVPDRAGAGRLRPDPRPARSTRETASNRIEKEIVMNRTGRIALTAGLTLTAALTVGGAALAGPDAAPDPGPRYVTVQDPGPGAPGSPDHDCPKFGPGPGPSAGTPTVDAPAVDL
jgi:hypothetical protein